ncbi:MAG: molybdopterin-dependent oxidoreductase [Plesiomonas sp.]|uniref:molybdopterin-dependent oxidoreductase n=1 Tax=Plesiomonas sp. TaxID=2486279 RepID=UPI003F3530E7
MKLKGLVYVAGLMLSALLYPELSLAIGHITDEAVLTISGDIGERNQGETAVFDEKSLDALPQHKITTTTPWYEGEKTFEGPLIRDVLALVKSKGKSITFVALNDYESKIPVSDINKYDVILARKIDGKMLSVRDKGPLFVIYPFNTHPELRTKLYYSRCAWQVDSIKIE